MRMLLLFFFLINNHLLVDLVGQHTVDDGEERSYTFRLSVDEKNDSINILIDTAQTQQGLNQINIQGLTLDGVNLVFESEKKNYNSSIKGHSLQIKDISWADESVNWSPDSTDVTYVESKMKKGYSNKFIIEDAFENFLINNEEFTLTIQHRFSVNFDPNERPSLKKELPYFIVAGAVGVGSILYGQSKRNERDTALERYYEAWEEGKEEMDAENFHTTYTDKNSQLKNFTIIGVGILLADIAAFLWRNNVIKQQQEVYDKIIKINGNANIDLQPFIVPQKKNTAIGFSLGVNF